MSSKGKEGIIYVLLNEAMPGYVKIGKTRGPIERRVLELSRSSSIPLPFECYYAVRVKDVDLVEKSFHEAFGDRRVNPRREFFNVSPERIFSVLKLSAVEDVTPSESSVIETKEDTTALAKAKQRKAPFNFKMVNIPPGEELVFVRDETVTCIVSPDQKNVIFQNETMSLSKASTMALGKPESKSYQGPIYWSYEGETLDERRVRLEREEEEIETVGVFGSFFKGGELGVKKKEK